MRENSLRRLLDAGKPTLCTRVYSSWPTTVEVIGHTGLFDYIEFAAEYAPFDYEGLDNFCRALELYNMGGMIKIDHEFEKHVAQRAIGSGFESILFANVENVEEGRECLAAVRPTTPEHNGKYGVINRRATLMSYGNTADSVKALEDAVAAFMIEKDTAVEQLEAILAGGVDMVQWGGADYSWSIGKPGRHKEPEVKAIERDVIERCLKAGVPPRAEIMTPDQAKYYLDLGVRHFSLGTDINILFNFLKSGGEEMRKALEP